MTRDHDPRGPTPATRMGGGIYRDAVPVLYVLRLLHIPLSPYLSLSLVIGSSGHNTIPQYISYRVSARFWNCLRAVTRTSGPRPATASHNS